MFMEYSSCLNCNAQLSGKFCSECGQKAATHRITPGHFITHDLMHGVLHLDKGILFTLKHVFTRPGYAAKDYISGKRVNYYNIFYLILLTVGFLLLAHGHKHVTAEQLEKLGKLPHSLAIIFALFANNFKYILLLQIPLFSLCGIVFFNRLNYNYFENFIIAGYATLGAFILSLIGTLIGMLWSPASIIFNLLIFPFVGWVYYQVTNHVYSKISIFFRMIGFGFFAFFLNAVMSIMTFLLLAEYIM